MSQSSAGCLAASGQWSVCQLLTPLQNISYHLHVPFHHFISLHTNSHHSRHLQTVQHSPDMRLLVLASVLLVAALGDNEDNHRELFNQNKEKYMKDGR